LYLFSRLLHEGRAAGWYALGLVVGLGTLSKLPMLFFAPGVLAFLLASPQHRRWLATPHPYLAFALALAVCLPPLVLWNARHDNIGWAHLLAVGNRTGGAQPQPLRYVGDFWGGQALALSPLLFLAELWALFAAVRRLRSSSDGRSEYANADRFLLAFTLPLLIVCLGISLRSRQEINWPVSAHITGLMAVAAWFVACWQRRETAMARAGIVAAVAMAGLLTLVAFFPAVLPAVAGPVSSRVTEKLHQTYGWPEIAGRVEAERRALSSDGTLVFAAGINYRVPSCARVLSARPARNALPVFGNAPQPVFRVDGPAPAPRPERHPGPGRGGAGGRRARPTDFSQR
jgi:4-amino-4-deoxy-L-arabinose transferase-like glycosyltransferase